MSVPLRAQQASYRCLKSAIMTTHHQNCRMYENKFPEVDDVVMVEVRLGPTSQPALCKHHRDAQHAAPPALSSDVPHVIIAVVQVTSIQEMGAYVHLLEYDSTEGMILLSELSRRRIRSINKLIKVR